MKNKDEQAFPHSRSHFKQDGSLSSVDWVKGLTKREWYAGMALQGLLSNSNDMLLKAVINIQEKEHLESYHEVLVINSLEIADALIKQEQKERG